MNAQSLIKIFDYNASVVRNQMEGITHAESLVQPIAGGQSINWLLGHLISSRTMPVEMVRAVPLWDDATRSLYRAGSDAIGVNSTSALAISQLLDEFNETHRRLIEGLPSLTIEQLSAEGHAGNTVYENFQYFHFHEAYHIGQLTFVAAHLGRDMAYITFD